MQTVYLSAISDWVKNTGNWGLGVVLAAIGIALVVVGLIEIFGGLKGENKEWKKAVEGLLIGFLGGLFAVWGATSVVSFFKKGQEIPHS